MRRDDFCSVPLSRGALAEQSRGSGVRGARAPRDRVLQAAGHHPLRVWAARGWGHGLGQHSAAMVEGTALAESSGGRMFDYYLSRPTK